MARTRHRSATIAAAFSGLGALVLAGAGIAFASSTGGASGAGADRVVVCESGTVSSGGVDTSSAVATRLPAGAPLPPGCRES